LQAYNKFIGLGKVGLRQTRSKHDTEF